MTRHRLDLNLENYAVHYRTRRWSAALIVAKTLRWLAARMDRLAHRSGAPTASAPRGPRPGLQRMTAALRHGHSPLRTRGFGR